MEKQETIEPEINENRIENGKKDFKQYELNIDKVAYRLKIEILENGNIIFKIRKINCLSYLFYLADFTYEEIINKFNLNKIVYNNSEKIFEFIDKMIIDKKFKLIRDKEIIKMEFIIKEDLIQNVKSIVLEEEIKLKYKKPMDQIIEEIIQMKKNGATSFDIVKKLNEINYNNKISKLENDLKKKKMRIKKKKFNAKLMLQRE